MANGTDYCWPCRPHDVEPVGDTRRRYNEPWTAEAALDSLKQWAERMGRPPMKVEWEKPARAGEPEHPSPYSLYKLFPSWAKFLEAAGMRATVVSSKARMAAVLERLPASTREIEQALGMKNAGAKSVLHRMREAGLVFMDRDAGVWRRVESEPVSEKEAA